ncbi:MAG: hypothetical protein COZ18_05000 [Flexibacter sp. CG_4_10_14_3_um_filter_32_15]|nr:MAG: hypothetical protein COZ18_05000 [Flexibacter sp. CG_4_10_14_3_um_filter_32_15]
MTHFKGKVVYQDLEGGFWGIVAEDGTEYKPESLAPEFQKEGLKVEVKGEEAMGFGIFMWGTPIQIKECKKI